MWCNLLWQLPGPRAVQNLKIREFKQGEANCNENAKLIHSKCGFMRVACLPKSQSFTSPSALTRTLLGLRSLWIIWRDGKTICFQGKIKKAVNSELILKPGLSEYNTSFNMLDSAWLGTFMLAHVMLHIMSDDAAHGFNNEHLPVFYACRTKLLEVATWPILQRRHQCPCPLMPSASSAAWSLRTQTPGIDAQKLTGMPSARAQQGGSNHDGALGGPTREWWSPGGPD